MGGPPATSRGCAGCPPQYPLTGQQAICSGGFQGAQPLAWQCEVRHNSEVVPCETVGTRERLCQAAEKKWQCGQLAAVAFVGDGTGFSPSRRRETSAWGR